MDQFGKESEKCFFISSQTNSWGNLLKTLRNILKETVFFSKEKLGKFMKEFSEKYSNVFLTEFH